MLKKFNFESQLSNSALLSLLSLLLFCLSSLLLCCSAQTEQNEDIHIDESESSTLTDCLRRTVSELTDFDISTIFTSGIPSVSKCFYSSTDEKEAENDPQKHHPKLLYEFEDADGSNTHRRGGSGRNHRGGRARLLSRFMSSNNNNNRSDQIDADDGSVIPRLGHVARIYRGNKARRWPHHGGICIDDEINCGASLIDKEWMVTAAHCFDDFKKDGGRSIDLSRRNLRRRKVRVKLGALTLAFNTEAGGQHKKSCIGNENPGEQLAFVERIIIHPNYRNPLRLSNDVALIKLTEPVKITPKVKPIQLQLSVEPILPGEDCFVMGWGVTEDFGYSVDLREAKVEIRPHPDCIASHGLAQIDHTMFCAGEIAKDAPDACRGDSGGGLVCSRGQEWILAGITSFGDGCNDVDNKDFGSRKPGVYANMDRLLGFISDTMAPNQIITQIKVVSTTKNFALKCPRGYTRVPQNLQAVAMGNSRVFICFKRSLRPPKKAASGSALASFRARSAIHFRRLAAGGIDNHRGITDLKLAFSYQEDPPCPNGYSFERLTANEDKRTDDGAYLKLCYTRSTRMGRPLTDIISIMQYWEYRDELNPTSYTLLTTPVATDYRKAIFLAFKR